MSKFGGGDSKNTLYCSFCGKSQNEVSQAAYATDHDWARAQRRAWRD